MADFKLPEGTEAADKLPMTRQELRNCFNNADGQIVPRPGIAAIIDIAGAKAARGSFEWDGSIYTVYGTNLHKFTNLETGANSIIDTIEGSENIQTATGFNHAVIVVPGGKIYTLDKADVVVDISGNPNFVPCVDVTHIDGRFIYVPSDGSPVFFSDVGAAGTVNALSFFDAELMPDNNNSCWAIKNTLYIGGTDSIELFRNTGASPVPFARITGAALRYGYIGGLLESVDTFLFVGRPKGMSSGIFAIESGNAIKISNKYIDRILRDYTLDELAETIPGRYIWNGYDVATFTLRRHSFGFYRGRWHVLDTVESGISRPWNAGFIVECGDKFYCSESSKLGRLDDVNTDFGDRITRIIDFGVRHPQNKQFRCQSIEIGISQGYDSNPAGTVAIMMSRDNVQYGPALYRTLGEQGKYHDKLVWNYSGGLGRYDGFMGVRIYTTEDIYFAVDKLDVNIV